MATGRRQTFSTKTPMNNETEQPETKSIAEQLRELSKAASVFTINSHMANEIADLLDSRAAALVELAGKSQRTNAALGLQNEKMRAVLADFERVTVQFFAADRWEIGDDIREQFRNVRIQANTLLKQTPEQSLAELFEALRTLGVDFLGELAADHQRTCEWATGESIFTTACGRIGHCNPEMSQLKFCHHCGGKIVFK